MEYPQALRPSDDPGVLVGQLARELNALLGAADADDHDERVQKNRWKAYALRVANLLSRAAVQKDWPFADSLNQALKDWRVPDFIELMSDSHAAVRFDVVGIGPELDFWLSTIEEMAGVMSEFAFRDFLKTRDGRPVLETLRSLDAEPRRWLALSEVAERNRYAHQVTDEKWLARTLVDLLERGLIQRLLGHEAVATETGPLDLKEVTGRTYPVYAITQAGHELALELAAVGCDEIETF